ncbi:MAG: hypothetical protein JKX70_12240 [Phycisphaerales bacterium]|nr:hypothetical protein [Phycisphaerales bacterium]
MFIKLVVMILVCGSSGIGLLSVRQSRLQAAHEMAQARHRCLRLDEQTGEIRMHIAQACTPDRVVELLGSQDNFDPAVHHPTKLGIGQDAVEFQLDKESTQTNRAAQADQSSLTQRSINEWSDEFDEEQGWILEDGSRVIFIGE